MNVDRRKTRIRRDVLDGDLVCRKKGWWIPPEGDLLFCPAGIYTDGYVFWLGTFLLPVKND